MRALWTFHHHLHLKSWQIQRLRYFLILKKDICMKPYSSAEERERERERRPHLVEEPAPRAEKNVYTASCSPALFVEARNTIANDALRKARQSRSLLVVDRRASMVEQANLQHLASNITDVVPIRCRNTFKPVVCTHFKLTHTTTWITADSSCGFAGLKRARRLVHLAVGLPMLFFMAADLVRGLRKSNCQQYNGFIYKDIAF